MLKFDVKVFQQTVTVTEFDEEVTATVIEQNTCYASAVSMVDCDASRRISRYWLAPS